MMQAIDILSQIMIGLGAIFVLIGAFGMVRMPELFTRMHAASIIDTLGAGLLVGGLMLQSGFSLVTVKLLFVLALAFFFGPTAAHAIAQAAIEAGIAPKLDQNRVGRRLPSKPAQGKAD